MYSSMRLFITCPYGVLKTGEPHASGIACGAGYTWAVALTGSQVMSRRSPHWPASRAQPIEDLCLS